jgi:hypothetical protein
MRLWNEGRKRHACECTGNFRCSLRRGSGLSNIVEYGEQLRYLR